MELDEVEGGRGRGRGERVSERCQFVVFGVNRCVACNISISCLYNANEWRFRLRNVINFLDDFIFVYFFLVVLVC